MLVYRNIFTFFPCVLLHCLICFDRETGILLLYKNAIELFLHFNLINSRVNISIVNHIVNPINVQPFPFPSRISITSLHFYD